MQNVRLSYQRFIGLLVLCGSLSVGWAGSATWLRSASISPDGQSIAFVYRGQIRIVPVAGGVSIPLTPAGAYSSSPVWSPDSQRLAFSSDLHGDDDVFTAPVGGGKMERLTFSSRPEVPTAFTPDGREVLFNAHRLGDPVGSRFTVRWGFYQLYSAPLRGGATKLVLPVTNEGAVWNAKGTQLLYGYTSSLDPGARQRRGPGNAGEIWLYNPDTQKHIPLVRDGYDARSAVWGPSDASVYYLSDRSGSLNIWQHNLKTQADVQLTAFKDQPIRGLSASKKGELAFTYAGNIYLLKPEGGQPQKLEVLIPEFAEDSSRPFEDQNSSEFVASPNGKLFALVARGNVFLLNRQGQSFQVTSTPAEERDVSFSPDGGFLVYASARSKDGLEWRIYKNRLPQKLEDLAQTNLYAESLINTGPGAAQQPRFSPDGLHIAFVYERREVRVIDTKSGKITKLYKPSDYHTSYSDGDLPYNWSPDSRYLVLPWRTVPFSVVSRWAIVPRDGSANLRPITQRLAEVDFADWTPDGRQLLLATRSHAARQLDQNAQSDHLYRVFMSEEARSDFLDDLESSEEAQAASGNVAKAEDSKDPPSPDKSYRFQSERKTSLEGLLSTDLVDWFKAMPDGKTVLLLNQWSHDLMLSTLDLGTQSVSELGGIEGDFTEAQFQLDSAGKTLYVHTPGQVHWLDLEDLRYSEHLSYRLRQRQNPAQMRQAAFDAFWLDIKQTFYQANMHGVDWNQLYLTYGSYLEGIATIRELADLLDEASGTLSASHLFPYAYTVPLATDGSVFTQTASLGVFIDSTYSGPGLKIAEVLPGGPLDRAQKLQPGDLITHINGRSVSSQGELDLLLDGLENQKVTVGFRRGTQAWSQAVRPISLDNEAALNQQRVIEYRRLQVDALSKGKLAYTYISDMDNESFITAYNDLLTMQDEKVAAILDIRGNGGGNLHRQLMTFLSGRPFARFGREGRPWGLEPSDRWLKPSALLVDTFAYSDGSIFPQAYQDAKLGQVIGETLVNTGTAVNDIQSKLIPELFYSVPILPFRRMDGSYYENNRIKPDILITHDPNAEQQGQDPVLERAIQSLLRP